MTEKYDEDYFLRGKQTGKSLYEDYRWMPELTVPMVKAMVQHLGIQKQDTVIDFGCARGYMVRAFRELGYDAHGSDCSKWAIENCDETVKSYVRNWVGDLRIWDWVIAKDVLEHVDNLEFFIPFLKGIATVGVFAVVPLSPGDGEEYVVPEYERDVTHIHRLTLTTWVDKFSGPGWDVQGVYRVKGIKDNYAHHPRGNGFITARRIW